MIARVTSTGWRAFTTSLSRVNSAGWRRESVAALVKKMKFLVQSTAVGQSVSGVVWNLGGGIAGAEIGEFTGVTVVAGTGADTGYGVIKVPVADFGGSALNVNDSVLCLVRTATHTSSLETATVIEE